VQNERCVARKQRKTEGEVLSPQEQAARKKGALLKQIVRAAAALNGIYEDTVLAGRVGVQRGAVIGWWGGAQPKPETLARVAKETGLAFEELIRFVYDEGDPPALPPSGPAGLQSGVQRARERLAGREQGRPTRSNERPGRDGDGGHG
jgi:transcriptional regulator with XRE-family HTH domain